MALSEAQRWYEEETGKKALYRMNGSDYHTLKYVVWLEKNLEELSKKHYRLVESF